jgi:hypothetical protein
MDTESWVKHKFAERISSRFVVKTNKLNKADSLSKKQEENDSESKADMRARVLACRQAPDLLGESALKSCEKRTADIMAVDFCRILLLYKRDFDVAMSTFVQKRKLENQKLLRFGVDIIREWNLVKIMTYAEQLQEITY